MCLRGWYKINFCIRKEKDNENKWVNFSGEYVFSMCYIDRKKRRVVVVVCYGN